MNFWNRNSLKKDTREEYASLLIELVEMNEDKKWLEEFHNLRLGHNLPGGGMGSLNDWSPSYPDDTEYAWFNLLYRITHWLLTEKKEPNYISENYSIKHRNETNILKCKNCGQKFQHPAIFEDHIASFYYYKYFEAFVSQKRLKDFTNPNFSYRNIEAMKMRESLESDYVKNEIVLFNFLKYKRVCPNCETKMEIDHLDCKIFEKKGKLELIMEKPVANNI